jgi:formylglycine-generating enzyme required for sulfatase activity
MKSAFRQLLKNPGFTAAVVFTQAFMGPSPRACAHPGSGIVVDRKGQVYFTDTGQGVWRLDERGRLSAHEGPAYHWLAMDHDGRLASAQWPDFSEPSSDILRIGTHPTLLLSSDFPLTTGRDGNLFFPNLGSDDRLRVYRLAPSGQISTLATLESASDGRSLKWLNGIAAGPDGVIYLSENAAVRKITPRGEVSSVAGNVTVEDCQQLPRVSAHLGPFLRGLDVASDGTVYVAASGCCALLKISPQGEITPVLRSVSPWSPTGVAVHGDEVFVLEYLHTPSGDRRDWTPRVRKLTRDGAATIVAAVERIPGGGSRAVPAAAQATFQGASAGDETVVGGMKLCWCPPGRFQMGSPRGEPERRPGEDQVEVRLTRGFWMAKFETTQGDWIRVMGSLPGPLTAELPEGNDYPVGNVSFAEAEAYCRKLTSLAHASGELPVDWEFRLPTEAQWEYACRARTTTATAFGDQLSSKQANFKGMPYNGAEPGPSLGRAAKVGGYPPNAWGLHDMHGNTFEWCRDWYHSRLPGGLDPDLYEAQAEAALNRTGDHSRVRRGGAWTDDGWACRSAFRLRFEPHRRNDHIGFRVVAVGP